MNPIGELKQPALWAIRKLVSDLDGRVAATGSLHSTGYRGDAVHLIDVSSVIAELIELLCWLLGRSNSMERPRILHALLQLDMKIAATKQQLERDLLDVRVADNSLQASLHRAAIFAARLSQRCSKIERRDALVLPSPGVPPFYGCIVSLSKIEKCTDDLVPPHWNEGSSSILLFPDLDAVYSYTGGQPVTVQSQHIKPLRDADYKTQQYVLFMQSVCFGSKIDEKNDRQGGEEDDTGEIDSSRARDLFYGRRKSAQVSLHEVLDQCMNRAVIRSEDKGPLNSYSFDAQFGRVRKLAIEALQKLLAEQFGMQDASDDDDNEEIISSSQAAAVFAGRHILHRDETTLLAFSAPDSVADSVSISVDSGIDDTALDGSEAQGSGMTFRRSPTSKRESGGLVSLPTIGKQAKILRSKGSRNKLFRHERKAAAVRVFISYAREDIQVASKLVNQLERRGIHCWIDARDYRPGGVFDEEVMQAIENCSAMLLVLSSSSNESDYIRREVAIADHTGKLILPLRVENVQPQRGLRKYLQHLRWIDAFKSEPDAVGAAVQVLKNNLPRYDLNDG